MEKSTLSNVVLQGPGSLTTLPNSTLNNHSENPLTDLAISRSLAIIALSTILIIIRFVTIKCIGSSANRCP